MGLRSKCVECVTGACPMQLVSVCVRPKAAENGKAKAPTRSIPENANDPAADDFEHFYDVCMVRASKISRRGTVESDCCELGHRFFRILLPGPGEPHWLL